MRNTIIVAVITGITTITGSFLTSKATADSRTNDINTQVQVLQERQSLQYSEVKESLDRIESKLDTLETSGK